MCQTIESYWKDFLFILNLVDQMFLLQNVQTVPAIAQFGAEFPQSKAIAVVFNTFAFG